MLLFLSLLAIGLTHLIGAVAAFGSTFLALPCLLLIHGETALPQVVPVLIVTGTLQAWLVCLRTHRDLVHQVWLGLALGALVGLPLGWFCAEALPRPLVLSILAGLLVGTGGLRLLGVGTGASGTQAPAALAASAGCLSGIVHGAFASGGAVLVPCARWLLPDRDGFRATLAALWSVLNPLFLLGLIWRRPPEAGSWWLIGWAAPVVLLASWTGDRLARRIPRRPFDRLVCALLILSGLLMAGRLLLPR